MTNSSNEIIFKTFGTKHKDVSYYDRIGAYLICIEDNRLAVIRDPQGYFLPGGGIDDNESLEECLKRECIEETGFFVHLDKHICSADMYVLHPKVGYFHPIQHYYCGKLIEKVCVPTEKDHNFEWIAIDDVENKMHLEIQSWAVKHYIDNHIDK